MVRIGSGGELRSLTGMSADPIQSGYTAHVWGVPFSDLAAGAFKPLGHGLGSPTHGHRLGSSRHRAVRGHRGGSSTPR